MTSHQSERFHDFERLQLYEEAIWSGANAPSGGEQACLLEMIASTGTIPARPKRIRPHLSLRWFALPRLPMPFLTWA